MDYALQEEIWTFVVSSTCTS